MTTVTPVGAVSACGPPSTGPARYDLAVYEGDSFHWQFKMWTDDTKTTPIDLTGASAMAQIRDKPGGTVLATLTCTVTAPNVVDVVLSATASETVAAGVWDLQVTGSGGWVTTYVAGKVAVTQDVTE